MSVTSPVLTSSHTSRLSRPPLPTMTRRVPADRAAPLRRAARTSLLEQVGQRIAAVAAHADPRIGLRHRRGDHVVSERDLCHVATSPHGAPQASAARFPYDAGWGRNVAT